MMPGKITSHDDARARPGRGPGRRGRPSWQSGCHDPSLAGPLPGCPSLALCRGNSSTRTRTVSELAGHHRLDRLRLLSLAKFVRWLRLFTNRKRTSESQMDMQTNVTSFIDNCLLVTP